MLSVCYYMLDQQLLVVDRNMLLVNDCLVQVVAVQTLAVVQMCRTEYVVLAGQNNVIYL